MTSPEHRVRRARHTSALPSCLLAALTFAVSPLRLAAQDPAPAPPNGKAASAGVYAEPQARRGEASFRTNCVSCHASSDFSGEKFKVAWVTRSAFDVFDVIRSQMPEDNPGALPRQDYVDIVAYLLSLNRYPAGADELPSEDDALKAVTIDEPPPGATHPLAAAARRGRAGQRSAAAAHSIPRR